MQTAAKWWHTEGEKIVCDLCPRECRLQEGQRGFCFVRQNTGGEMELTTYGKSTGFCIDPIEKKPLNHFLPGTPVLSFGTAGCNLGCKFCQNWDISKSKEIEILSQDASPEAIVKAAKDSGCRSIAFTYNDPVIWAEYAIDTAKIARQEGIKTVAVTAGYISPEARDEFFPWIDAANVDLKAFSDVFYRKLTFARIDAVLDTLKWLKTNSDTWFEITNLVIPGQNDSPEELGKMCDWVLENLGPDVPVHFTAFHPDFKMMDTPATPHETLIDARTLAYERGIRFAYVGNVLDQERQTTWCPDCGLALIERDHYELGAYRIKDSACEKCGTQIPGVFENERGDWGRKRVPVKIPDTPSISVSSNRETTTPESQGPRQDFSQDEIDGLLAYARGWVESAINGQGDGPELLPELSEISGFGVFITLKRGSLLRACRGQFNEAETKPLAELIKEASISTATSDVRFPSILPAELDSLNLEISPMYDFQEVAAKGEDRVGVIEVGEHGLIINHPQGRGLLLPQVATENNWDARTFLNQVAVKAGLPKDAWINEAARIMTFRGRQFVSPAKRQDLEVRRFPQDALRTLFHAVDSLARNPQASVSVPKLFAEPVTSGLGIVLQFADGLQSFAIRDQASLIEVIQQASASIRESAERENRPIGPLERITFLSHPIQLTPGDEPSRLRMLARSAILARQGSEFAVFSPGDQQQQQGSQDPIAGALQGLKLAPDQWAQSGATLTAFQIFNVIGKPPEAAATSTNGGDIRQPWAAGKFYPDDPAEMTAQLAEFFEAAAKVSDDPRESCRAIMLPHAGWVFCGDIIAETLQRIEVPDVAIIIGPKHTPNGANWSVTPASRWHIPGADVPVDTELVDRLTAAIPELQKEPAAHQSEHGSEVLIPFLHHLNPGITVLPIVIGAAGYDDLASLSQALSEVLQESKNPPLLIISSDMNHFADDAENRRRDRMALAQLEAGDSRGLFEVCQSNDISMCGLRPAVAVMNALNGDLDIEVTHYETSARITGDTQRVVGYAGAILR